MILEEIEESNWAGVTGAAGGREITLSIISQISLMGPPLPRPPPQDLDSGHYGSGFPLPEWRRKLLAQHLGKPGAPAELPPYGTDAEREYAAHPWNINNMPRCKDSALRWAPAAVPAARNAAGVAWLAPLFGRWAGS
jgi:hypothetical protein